MLERWQKHDTIVTMSLYFPSQDDLKPRTIFPGVAIATCVAEKLMLSRVEMQPGAEVAEHSHPHEQVGIVLAGHAIFHIGGEEKRVGPGDMFRIPGGVKHKVIALDETFRALDVFYPVREDYR